MTSCWLSFSLCPVWWFVDPLSCVCLSGCTHTSAHFLRRGWWVAVSLSRCLSEDIFPEPHTWAWSYIMTLLPFRTLSLVHVVFYLCKTAKDKPDFYSFVVSLLFLEYTWVVISSPLEVKNFTSQYLGVGLFCFLLLLPPLFLFLVGGGTWGFVSTFNLQM